MDRRSSNSRINYNLFSLQSFADQTFKLDGVLSEETNALL